MPHDHSRNTRRSFLKATVPAGMAALTTWNCLPITAALGPRSATGGDTGYQPALAAARPLRLLFSGPDDVANTWGKLHFGATPMHQIQTCEHPGFTLACCRPRDDGTWDIYGQVFTRGKEASMFDEQHTWRLIHATTRDGVRFENVETVFEAEPGPWTDHLGLAYNPDAREFLALKLKIDDNGFGYRAYFSSDGRSWKEHAANPLFYDCDSLGLFWSENAHRFVCTNKTLQPFPKHIQDHGGTHPQNKDDNLRDRRVIAVRSSPDGRVWQPSDSMMDVWNRLGTYRPLPTRLMMIPDCDDPPDMEFYRGIGFWYHDRSYMVVLNYAASPLAPRKHGPQLDTEWWVSRDGLRWERPYRDVNALGDAFPAVVCITHNPMVINGDLMFHFGNRILGMKQDRISFVGARANAEFSTVDFTAPNADLLLNAAVPSPDRPFARDQAYVMAGMEDKSGNSVPGFEPEHCLVRNQDAIALPLLWNGRSARVLAGQQVRLRLLLRSANVYAVTGSG